MDRWPEREMTNETKKAGGSSALGPLGPGQRWSVARKREVVLRMLKGASFDALFPLHEPRPSRGPASRRVDGISFGYASKLATPTQPFRGGFAVTRLCGAAGVVA